MPATSNISQSIDDKDRRILALVQRDAKLPQAEIARRVGLSPAAVNERLKKLETAGLLLRWVAVVHAKDVGAGSTGFAEVSVEHPRSEPGFIEQLRGIDAVQECHHITGELSLLVKIRVRDMEGLQRLLIHKINA